MRDSVITAIFFLGLVLWFLAGILLVANQVIILLKALGVMS